MERKLELQSKYESYLLRLWYDNTQEPPSYRIMLQHVVTQQQHFFADLPDLLAFLASHGRIGQQTELNRPPDEHL